MEFEPGPPPIARCTRLHAGRIVSDKEGPTLIDALDSLWVSIHGPMREFIMDGESGIATDADPASI